MLASARQGVEALGVDLEQGHGLERPARAHDLIDGHGLHSALDKAVCTVFPSTSQAKAGDQLQTSQPHKQKNKVDMRLIVVTNSWCLGSAHVTCLAKHSKSVGVCPEAFLPLLQPPTPS
jgi:hypothetical protein